MNSDSKTDADSLGDEHNVAKDQSSAEQETNGRELKPDESIRQTNSGATNSEPRSKRSKVSILIDKYVQHLQNIEICASEHVPNARKVQETTIKRHAYDLLVVSERCSSGTVGRERTVALLEANKSMDRIRLHASFAHEHILTQSLLIAAFSAFDAYLGRLLRHLYRRKKELLNRIERQINLAELVKFSDLGTAVDSLIDKDIESLLRASYVESFSKIASRFDITTLKDFDSWPAFVELSQRRNLITHTDGIVSQQYLDICTEQKASIEGVKVGDKLEVTPDYLACGLELLAEIGIKLGFTLTRKCFPKEADDLDTHLIDIVLDLLHRERLRLAENIANFGLSFKGKPANDRTHKIKILNYAQCQKWNGKRDQMLRTLGEIDWSASIRDFRLAVAVLKDELETAAKLMREIGKEGEIVDMGGYVGWPIFRQFRGTTEFFEAFQSIYGESFEASAAKTQPQPDIEGSIPSSADQLIVKIDHATNKITITTTHAAESSNGAQPVEANSSTSGDHEGMPQQQ